MTEPCKRHTKRIAVDFRVVPNDERTFWAVGERRECVKCGDRVVRMARGSIGKTAREALQAYGCTDPEINRYMAQHFPEEIVRTRIAVATTKPAIEVPLHGWPFPVSVHAEPPQ